MRLFERDRDTARSLRDALHTNELRQVHTSDEARSRIGLDVHRHLPLLEIAEDRRKRRRMLAGRIETRALAVGQDDGASALVAGYLCDGSKDRVRIGHTSLLVIR